MVKSLHSLLLLLPCLLLATAYFVPSRTWTYSPLFTLGRLWQSLHANHRYYPSHPHWVGISVGPLLTISSAVKWIIKLPNISVPLKATEIPLFATFPQVIFQLGFKASDIKE